MKNFCNKIMKLNTDFPFGQDYSGIALLVFLDENDILKSSSYKINDFTEFLYRFYSDNDDLRKKHYHKMINNIQHYSPFDFQKYVFDTLKYIEEYYDFIECYYDSFSIKDLPENTERNITMVKKLIKTAVIKYLGEKYKNYSSIILKDECVLDLYDSNSRIFNRALEKSNYCFICNDDNIENLTAVCLLKEDDKILDPDNYLILCKKHANMFIEGALEIKRNGYAYINGEKQPHHLEIDILKRIRKYLFY